MLFMLMIGVWGLHALIANDTGDVGGTIIIIGLEIGFEVFKVGVIDIVRRTEHVTGFDETNVSCTTENESVLSDEDVEMVPFAGLVLKLMLQGDDGV